MEQCPVCEGEVSVVWEKRGKSQTGMRWWMGIYACDEHGIMSGYGTLRRKVKTLRSWTPACPDHGTPSVIRVYPYRFACVRCDRQFEHRNGRLLVTRRPGMKNDLWVLGKIFRYRYGDRRHE